MVNKVFVLPYGFIRNLVCTIVWCKMAFLMQHRPGAELASAFCFHMQKECIFWLLDKYKSAYVVFESRNCSLSWSSDGASCVCLPTDVLVKIAFSN